MYQWQSLNVPNTLIVLRCAGAYDICNGTGTTTAYRCGGTRTTSQQFYPSCQCHLKNAGGEGVSEAAQPGALELGLYVGGTVAGQGGRVDLPRLDSTHQLTSLPLSGQIRLTTVTRMYGRCFYRLTVTSKKKINSALPVLVPPS